MLPSDEAGQGVLLAGLDEDALGRAGGRLAVLGPVAAPGVEHLRLGRRAEHEPAVAAGGGVVLDQCQERRAGAPPVAEVPSRFRNLEDEGKEDRVSVPYGA